MGQICLQNWLLTGNLRWKINPSKLLTYCRAQCPSAARWQLYFLISLTVILADVFAGQRRATPANVRPRKKKGFLSSRTPRTTHLMKCCQGPVSWAARRKLHNEEEARQPAQSGWQTATPTPHTLITFWKSLRQIKEKDTAHTRTANLLLPLNHTHYLLCTLMTTTETGN